MCLQQINGSGDEGGSASIVLQFVKLELTPRWTDLADFYSYLLFLLVILLCYLPFLLCCLLSVVMTLENDGYFLFSLFAINIFVLKIFKCCTSPH